MKFHEQKLQRIIELLDAREYLDTMELTDELAASRSTVQRCLSELHELGLVQRIHGGVKRIGAQGARPIGFDEREGQELPGKRAICQAAVRMIPDAGFVYLDAGTTMYPIVDLLRPNGHPRVEFITNDVRIAAGLSARNLRHILIGGQVHPVTQSISGPAAQQMLTSYMFDVAMISADSVRADCHVVGTVTSETILKKVVLSRSKTAVLLATATKWRQITGSTIASLGEFKTWIVDEANDEMRDACRLSGVELVETRRSGSPARQFAT
jgi:DeoR family fructose operon transcriptional repressor